MPHDNRHVLPMGATPYDRVEVIDAREWMTEPADMGGALALDRAIVRETSTSYRFRWHWSLGGAA